MEKFELQNPQSGFLFYMTIDIFKLTLYNTATLVLNNLKHQGGDLMENLLLFVSTTVVYFTVWLALSHFKETKKLAKDLAIIALLCLPLNINGNVFTVIGNASSSKSVYSVFSLYQRADKDAGNLLGGLYQKAGHDAVVLFGFQGYQEAGNDSVLGFGLSGYQKAGNESGTLAGISGFQNAKKNTIVILGLAGYQKAGNIASMLCCFAGKQNGNNGSGLAIGLVGYQNSEKNSTTGIGMAIYQRVQKEDRAFAVWSTIKNKNESEK